MTEPTGARPIRCGVVGTGSMGRHHVRLLSEMPEAELVGLYDAKPELAADMAKDRGTKSCTSLEELADLADAIVLAIPTYAHHSVGKELLERGCHLLVEKPLASSLEEADELLAAAVSAGKTLSVGHVEFYNPAVQALLRVGETPRFVEVQRLSPFTPRSLDVDVIRDLMIHDLQILHALDPSELVEVRATGIDVLSPKIDIANARLEFASGGVANVTASRVSAEPVRKLRAFFLRRYYSVDYRSQDVKGFGLEEEGVERRISPELVDIEPGEPLQAELRAFLAACRGEDSAVEGGGHVDGAAGRRALATALEVRRAIRESRR